MARSDAGNAQVMSAVPSKTPLEKLMDIVDYAEENMFRVQSIDVPEQLVRELVMRERFFKQAIPRIAGEPDEQYDARVKVNDRLVKEAQDALFAGKTTMKLMTEHGYYITIKVRTK